MLEKKVTLECNSSDMKPVDMNSADDNCHGNHTDDVSDINAANEDILADLRVKADEKSAGDMKHCDEQINVMESAVGDILSVSKMDDQTAGIPASSASQIQGQATCSVQTKANEISGVCGTGSSSVGPVAISANGDDTQDATYSHPNDNPNDSNSAASNKENAPPVSGTSDNEVPPMSAISNMVGSTSASSVTAVQPLPSNMVNKTSFPLETQYMQQQSQIFVFSTELANKAAESCLSGQYPSIIAFHCAQPGTKSFLEKYPLKVQQFNRQNPAVWLNTLASMKHGSRNFKGTVNQFHGVNTRLVGPQYASAAIPCMGHCNVHSTSACFGPQRQGQWSCGNSSMAGITPDLCGSNSTQPWAAQHFGPGARFSNPVTQGINIRQGPISTSVLNYTGTMVTSAVTSFHMAGVCTPFSQVSGGPAVLSGVKIPDENLTPEQRQHREEQLATIRKMQQMLFPEQQQHQHFDQVAVGIVNPQSNTCHASGEIVQQIPSRNGSSGDVCIHTSANACFSHQPCMNDHENVQQPHMFASQNAMGSGFHQHNLPETSVSAQLKWQELQHQFYEERKRKQELCTGPVMSYQTGIHSHQQQQVQPPSEPVSLQQPSVNCPSPGAIIGCTARTQGPPPPYHSTGKRGLCSSHPSSPNPSSLSLSSPRMISGLSSPADPSRHFPHPTTPGSRLPNPNSGAATPVGSSSLHTTPLSSPKALNSSNPGSNNSSLIKTPNTPSAMVSTPTGTPTNSCVNTLSVSAPCTSVQCVSSRKQTLCSSDIQESGAVTPVTSNADVSSASCTVSSSSSVSNAAQGDTFCHGSNQCSQPCSKQDSSCTQASVLCSREPNLMPVPSPQQIQYLNSFDGQELTIQKQPNTSIREMDIVSPVSVPPSVVMTSTTHSRFQSPEISSFPNTPGSCPPLENSQDSFSGRYPASAPASMEGNMKRFSSGSPQMQGFEAASHHVVSSIQEESLPQFPTTSSSETVRSGAVAQTVAEQNGISFTNLSHPNLPYSPSQIGLSDNSSRFPVNSSDSTQRFHSPHDASSPMEMVPSRFVTPTSGVSSVETTVPSVVQFHNIRSESHSYPTPTETPTSTLCLSGTFPSDSIASHSHLQNLQKMTQPFENSTSSKVSAEIESPGGLSSSNTAITCSSNNSLASYNDNHLPTAVEVGASARLTHFDPLASMAAMSETTSSVSTSVGNMEPSHNNNNINTSGITVDCENVLSSTSSANFPSGAQSSTGLNQSMTSISNQCNQFGATTQMAYNLGSAPQTASYSLITPVSVQQPTVQCVTSTFSASMQTLPLSSHTAVVQHHHNPLNSQDESSSAVSCLVTTNHPGIPAPVSAKTLSMCASGTRSNFSFNGSPHFERNPVPLGAAANPSVMVRIPNASSFNSANIRVKASAPNTIQYLPARPQCVSAPSSRPPSLEFLQRFAAPLTNLDNKVPTHNLQYFPTNRTSNVPSGHDIASPGPHSVMSVHRPANMMIGAALRASNPVSHVGGQLFPVGSSLHASESSVFGRPHCPPNSPVMPVNQVAGNQPSVFSGKQTALSVGGIAPDATQPLPPSMGQSFNYKQSTFYGPTTADPNYAVQFHNFQQQLYATNTRGAQMSSQNASIGQNFFGSK